MTVDPLTPKARALIEVGRSGLRATPADRERIDAALRARLGSDALPSERGLAAPSRGPGWRAVAGVSVVVGAIVAALTLAVLRPATSPAGSRKPAPLAQRALPVEVPSTPSVASPPSAAATPATARPSAPAETTTPSTRAGADHLKREVALLSRATSALRAGQAEKALLALDEHQRKFANGALREERRAAKAQALCALGRVAEGLVELARLAPASPAAVRARQACEAGGVAAEPVERPSAHAPR